MLGSVWFSATSGIQCVAVRSCWALCGFQLPVAYSVWPLGHVGLCVVFSYQWYTVCGR